MYRFTFIFLILQACTSNPVELKPDANDSTNLHLQDSSIQTTDTTSTTETLKDSVEIKFTYSGSYCNGAYPSEEILEDIRKARALSEITLIFKNQSEQIFTTDSKGRIIAFLEPGKYDVHISPDNDAEKAPYNVSCEKYYEKSWGSLSVDTSRSNYKIHIEFPCDLCDETIKMRP